MRNKYINIITVDNALKDKRMSIENMSKCRLKMGGVTDTT